MNKEEMKQYTGTKTVKAMIVSPHGIALCIAGG